MDALPLELLVVGQREDAEHLAAILNSSVSCPAQLSRAESVREALDIWDQQRVDAILLVVHSNGDGGEAVARLRVGAPSAPVILVADTDDEMAATAALQAGAQDCLIINELDCALLERAVSYAVERQRVSISQEQARQRGRRDREMHALQDLYSSQFAAVTARAFGVMPLKQGLPQVFQEMAAAYREILEQKLDELAYHDSSECSVDRLQAMAERLGFLRAGPRDVIDLHTAALRVVPPDEHPARTQARIDEARVLLVQLMGNLVSFYREYPFGLVRATEVARSEEASGEDK